MAAVQGVASCAPRQHVVAEPANVLYPEEYAKRVKALEKLGLEVEVLGEKELEKLGFRTLLADEDWSGLAAARLSGLKTFYAATETFLARAPEFLTADGALTIVANAFLRYQPILDAHFKQTEVIAGDAKFKVYLSKV